MAIFTKSEYRNFIHMIFRWENWVRIFWGATHFWALKNIKISEVTLNIFGEQKFQTDVLWFASGVIGVIILPDVLNYFKTRFGLTLPTGKTK